MTPEEAAQFQKDLEEEYDAPNWVLEGAREAAAEVLRLRAEVAGYRAAICFETTCVGCARMLDQLARLEADRDQYRDLAEQLYQPEPCSFDHHGGCQEHLWLEPGPGEECPDGRAQRLFAKKEERG